MRILILGGYGLIGAELARALGQQGHDLILLGRSSQEARKAFPNARWIIADLSSLITKKAWMPHLSSVDVVINAAGALQDGASDRLSVVHDTAIRALIVACEQSGITRFVQISAPGARADASTSFLRTKSAGDRALQESQLDWIIFRPGLVIARNAYGGTVLLRLLAAMPFVQILVLASRPVQTVSSEDVSDAVCRAVSGDLTGRVAFDLVEPTPHTLSDVVATFRSWLGFPPTRLAIELPRSLGLTIASVADLAGWLGWRPVIRTTALRAIDEGVVGDPRPWRAVVGRDLTPLWQTLALMPATAQERLFARAQLALPLIILCLSGFWIVSGLVGLAQAQTAAQILGDTIDPQLSRWIVRLGSVADIALGLGVLIRGTSRLACIGMVVLTLAYLVGSAVVAPQLWTDPLGPMLKAVPAAVLALLTAGMLEKR